MAEPVKHKRRTAETEIEISFNPWGKGQVRVSTGVGFLDHMLHLFGVHGGFDLEISARGDLHVDFHHTVEDVGLTLGEALDRVLADRSGIRRYGEATIPMEESLAQVVVDLARRPCVVIKGEIGVEKIGQFDTELVKEFYKALAMSGRFTLHVRFLYGENAHHLVEASFKALGHALRAALSPHEVQVLSTKGVL
ncbi:MAG: imidazoleglycerol-phosphate dehydratase HisB [Thermodesulfobacteria bacterium]|nr:imidazoleglycerol-phosphate dehydratase HisB [Thermodesulfobacteriota bacterium]